MLVSDPGAPFVKQKRPPIPSGVIAITIFIATEVMVFAALISSYLVLRSNTLEWPPWGQPRLPVWETAFNTAVLLASGFVLFKAHKAFTSDAPERAKKLLGISMGLGTFFVLFQGYEWIGLINFGLTITSSTYGGLFYLIIGTHAVHAIAAMMGLIYCFTKITSPSPKRLQATEFWVAQLFWYFVVGVWPILYVLVYLL